MAKAAHQLTVIMFTDIVGYTAMMGEDEGRALASLKINKEIHRKWLNKYQGKWLKEMGDGVLASFGSVADAVFCAGAIISSVKEAGGYELRIGIHLGDVVVDNKEIYGDGVNIASRIQALAKGNHIIVSESIHQNIRNKEGVKASSFGEHQLKNVTEPLQLFELDFDQSFTFSGSEGKKKSSLLYYVLAAIIVLAILYFALPAENVFNGENTVEANQGSISSIAVLPFDNLTGDESQNYLIDGIQENLNIAISQIESLNVISRTSTLSFKERNGKSVQDIAEELRVDAVIESSVLKSDDSIRINVKLIKAFPEEEQLWTKVFDRSFNNILSLFDDVAEAVASEISNTITGENSVKEVNPEAFKAYMNGKFYSENRPTEENINKALEFFKRAIELDSGYAPAYAGIAWIWINRLQLGLSPGSMAVPNIYSYYQKAIDLDPEYPESYYHKAVMSIQGEWNWSKGEEAFKKALELNPTHSIAHAHYAHLLMILRRFDEAIEQAELAIKIDPLNDHVLGLCAIVFHWTGNSEKAREIYKKNDAIFAKDRMMEAMAYTDGDYQTSSRLLKKLFKQDSLSFEPTDKDDELNAYKALIKKIAVSAESNNPGISLIFISELYSRLGAYEDAIRLILQAYEIHDPNLPYFFVVPQAHDGIKNDPRIMDVAQKMKLQF